MTSVTFDSLDLPVQLKQALSSMNYSTPTSIQAQAIPVALTGRDVIGSAQTGTGKTAAFAIPMIAKLLADPDAHGLILTPTRELASQIADVVRKLTMNCRDIRFALLIGGEHMGKQFDQLRANPRIVIGTPGRINDHLRRNGKMLGKVRFVAVDEADRMLDMGFSEQIDEILATLPTPRQTVMFSATFPEAIIRFSKNYLHQPERISVHAEQISAPKIKHEVLRTSEGTKYNDLLGQLYDRKGSVIIFVKTQHGTERLAKKLANDDFENVAIHGGLRQNQREKAVRAFRQEKARIMVATDVAARGLDIPHIEHVINYDLPQVAEDYIHRIGRTARAGAEGNAMAFVLPSENGKWNAINRLMNPNDAPARKERGERPDRRPQKHGARDRNGGSDSHFKRDGGFKKRDDRPFSNDRPAFKKRDEYQNDRPRQDAERGEFKRKPTDKNWNAKEGRKEYKSEFRNDHRDSEYRGDRKSSGGYQKRNNDEGSRFGGRPNDRNRGFDRGNDRGENRGPRREFSRDRDDNRGNNEHSNVSRPVGRDGYQKRDRSASFGQKRDGGFNRNNDRNDNRGFNNGGGKRFEKQNDGWGNSERSNVSRPVDGDRPRSAKPKQGKPAGKKPFKFKEHSRKDRPRAAV